jgi:hypothetical protein
VGMGGDRDHPGRAGPRSGPGSSRTS